MLISALIRDKFSRTFIRKSKKAFISFYSNELTQRITRNHDLLTRNSIYKRIRRAGLKLRLTDADSDRKVCVKNKKISGNIQGADSEAAGWDLNPRIVAL
ncbi:MAG: hypothetical protein QW056_06495 [Candidatus Bathyarchaeia archaeon]